MMTSLQLVTIWIRVLVAPVGMVTIEVSDKDSWMREGGYGG